MKTIIIAFLFLTCIASGQEKVGVSTFDSLKVIYYKGRAVKDIVRENDSLRQEAKKLKFLYDKTLGISRKYRKQIDSLRKVYKSIKNTNTIEDRISRLEEYMLKAIPKLKNHRSAYTIPIDSCGLILPNQSHNNTPDSKDEFQYLNKVSSKKQRPINIRK